MTDAPIDEGGATEAYFIGETLTDELITVNLNCFTRNENAVPFKLILGDVESESINRQYLIGAHEISFCLPNKIEGGEMCLGFVDSDIDGNKKFYFTSADTGKRIVARSDENSARLRSATKTSIETCLKLKTILEKAGAIFDKAEDENRDINLDSQTVTKDNFLNLFEKK